MTVPQADYCSQANAEKLARTIERYWREKMPGCFVTCWTEPVHGATAHAHGTVFAVRSTMINGRPQLSSIRRAA